MYTLTSATVRRRGQTHHDAVDIGDLRLVDLYARYDVLYITLTNPYVTDDAGELVTMGLDLFTLQDTLRPRTDTVSEWLSGLGNQSLPTDTPAKVMKRDVVTYRDARNAGIKLDRIYHDAHPDSDYPLDDRRNLLLYSDTLDHETFYNNHLITLGGILHHSEHTAHGIVVRQAVDTLETSGVDTVGLLDFTALGGITQLPWSGARINPDANGNPLKYRVALDFDEAIDQQPVGVVFLGRLYVGEPYVRKVSPRRVVLDTEQLDWAGLYQFIRTKVDLSALGLEHPYQNDDVAILSQWTADDTIRAMFDLPQTFVVLLPQGQPTITHHPITLTKVSGRAIAYQPPVEPVIGPFGYYQDYVAQNDWGQWVLNFPEAWDYQYFHDTYSGEDRQFTTQHHDTVHPRRFPALLLQRIAYETLTDPE